MGLTWSQAESAAFQARLKADLAVWGQVLWHWRLRLASVEIFVGVGPGASLSGAAWNAAKTLFVDRILPIVESGQSVVTWTGIHLGQYAAAETPLLDDGGFLDEDNLVHAVDVLDRVIHALTHAPLIPPPLRDNNPVVHEVRRQRAKVQEKIDDLRLFSSAVSGLWSEEEAASSSMRSAIASISKGSLSSDGTYLPGPGDNEAWRNDLNDYRRNHPVNPDPVFGGHGPYGGNQGSLASRWDHLTPEEQQAYMAIIRSYFPGLTDQEIRDVINQMNATGCGYVAGVNSIIARYANNPTEFERRFGFPLYAPDGSINYDRLFTDYWCWIQTHRPGTDPTGNTQDHAPAGTYPTGDDFLKDYLAEHGIKVTTVEESKGSAGSYSAFSNDHGTVFVSIEPIIFYDDNGKQVEAVPGFHAVTVTGEGVDSSGRTYWTVSSWGQHYRIYPDDYAGKGTFDLDHDGRADTDTDGDGRLDYQTMVGGQMTTVNYDNHFVVQAVTYD